MVFYNENNPKMAAWLRELIKAGLIAPGVVDERDIRELQPDELTGFIQCHFFAGIGGWPFALRLAGWPDDKEVWTGSCPCQPFSVAGKTETVGDERHLWPAFYRLLAECRPATVFGEQVAGAAGLEWLAGIRVDLEGSGYAVGAADLPAACVGSPHPRQRLFWVADARHERTGRSARPGEAESGRAFSDASGCGEQLQRMGNAASARSLSGAQSGVLRGKESTGPRNGEPERSGSDGRHRLGHSDERGLGTGNPTPRANDAEKRERCEERTSGIGERLEHASRSGREERDSAAISIPEKLRSSANSGAWSDYEIIGFTDGKARRIESGLKPLVDGLPKELVRCSDPCAPFHAAEARAMRLHGYGNAIVPEVAAEFIRAYLAI